MEDGRFENWGNYYNQGYNEDNLKRNKKIKKIKKNELKVIFTLLRVPNTSNSLYLAETCLM